MRLSKWLVIPSALCIIAGYGCQTQKQQLSKEISRVKYQTELSIGVESRKKINPSIELNTKASYEKKPFDVVFESSTKISSRTDSVFNEDYRKESVINFKNLNIGYKKERLEIRAGIMTPEVGINSLSDLLNNPIYPYAIKVPNLHDIENSEFFGVKTSFDLTENNKLELIISKHKFDEIFDHESDDGLRYKRTSENNFPNFEFKWNWNPSSTNIESSIFYGNSSGLMDFNIDPKIVEPEEVGELCLGLELGKSIGTWSAGIKTAFKFYEERDNINQTSFSLEKKFNSFDNPWNLRLSYLWVNAIKKKVSNKSYRNDPRDFFGNTISLSGDILLNNTFDIIDKNIKNKKFSFESNFNHDERDLINALDFSFDSPEFLKLPKDSRFELFFDSATVRGSRSYSTDKNHEFGGGISLTIPLFSTKP